MGTLNICSMVVAACLIVSMRMLQGPAAKGGNAPQSGGMTYDEATKILQETFLREQEHKQKMLDRRMRRGEVRPGEHLTRAEMDARMLAFLCVPSTFMALISN